MEKRFIFLSIYLIVDFIYVVLSKNVYDNATIKIQGTPMKNRFLSIIAAYICMGLGWYYLTAPTAERWSKNMHPILAGSLAGLIHGLMIIGTLNFTLNAMLNKWSEEIMIRDLSWGIGWPIILTLSYTYVKYMM